MAFHEPGQAAFQVLDLLGELPDPLGRQTQGNAGGLQHRLFTVLVVLAAVREPRAGAEEFSPPARQSRARPQVPVTL
ncbi:hypothetical protein [Streptomyces sp. WAC01526]|uniref:hypothetical protein n=1 Tax=Streptomyces sp. WAC01526 TaxID=2588709 RepID=UPI0021CCB10A|nr:hypothetical protein [Streptomyces sp. WAC01526]